ncbi:MAG: DUF4382 domain-containing protein [Candidatus Eisenbacteria bacterium]
MKRHPLALTAAALLFAFALGACSTNSTGPASGTLRVHMTDAPGDFEQVNLVVREVAVHIAGADSMGGWEVLSTDSASYDLLTLRNGVFTQIGKSVIPAGHYTQIRLKLGPGSNVVVGGIVHPLTVPSGLQTGLKIVGQFDVPAGGLVDVALEFDAERSIHLTGGGNYMLKPVVKAMPFSTAGAISGSVLPPGAADWVYAIVATDTLGATVPGEDGAFLIPVLPSGTYTVAVDAAAGYRDTTLAGVAVTAGHTTSVGTLTLSPQ